jgi:hypothetical protein
MSITYINADLRRQVMGRANNCCEYCLLSQKDNLFSFQVDHIISEKHDGETTFDNLALSCPSCNHFKGSDVGSFDKLTGQFTPLYNPRIQHWDEHFVLEGAIINGLTPEGRVTIRLLKMNRLEQINERLGLIRLGNYPCKK